MTNKPNRNKVTKNILCLHDSTTNTRNINDISFIYLSSDIIIEDIEYKDNIMFLYARSSKKSGACPYCNHESKRVHSKYTRTIKDLSILGRGVILVFEARKFFCNTKECMKRTFAEQPGDEIFRYRRNTRRLELAITRHGLKTSSISASKLLFHLGINLSYSTVLRNIHRLTPSQYADIKIIGIDDWAWRKGINYGTIILDMHSKYPVDLLENRAEENFKNWIENHKLVNTVSRDRSTDYSSAVKATGRPITEIADKFHLIKNMSERLLKTVSVHYADYREAIRRSEPIIENPIEEKVPILIPSHKKEKIDSRMVMFREVKELQAKGFKPTTISKRLGIARQTATKYYNINELPKRNSKERNKYHIYDKYVEEHVANGNTLKSAYKEISDIGFKGTLTPFYTHYAYLSNGHGGRKSSKERTKKMARPIDERSKLVPLKAISSVVDRAIYNKTIDSSGQQLIDTLLQFDWFAEIDKAAKSLYAIITGSESDELIRWMKKFWKTRNPTLKTFLVGIKRDYKAVKNTICYNITNGITEGFVNKLKAVKRIMYGRAGLELLKRKMVMEHLFFN